MNFRRWIIALSVLALFAGLAGAQQTGSSALVCQTNQGTVTPLLRSEGFTELTGDILLTCNGGTALTNGANIPLVNITVTMSLPVTSRLLPASGIVPVTGSLSEALLIVDEPTTLTAAGSLVANYGPSAPLIKCTTPLTGCAEIARVATGSGPGAGNEYLVASLTPAGTALPTTQDAPNVFQGIVNGSQVTFNGIPVLPPGSSAVTRTYRITNIRVAAASAASIASGTVVPVNASISTSPFSALPIGNAVPAVAFISNSLNGAVSDVATFPACTSVKASDSTTHPAGAFASTLNFKEQFGTAFKVRVVPLSNTAFAGQATNPTGQQTPGGNYNSESGFIFGAPSGTGNAGLADFGTRLKATFVNVPSNVNVYVTVNNTGVTAPSPIGGTSVTPYAQLVTGETATSLAFAGTFPGVSGTFNGGTIVQIPISNGTGTAVWEVLNTDPNQIENIKFGVYVTFTVTPGVTPVSPQVMMSYAPTPNGIASTQAAFATASSTLPIPRFADQTTASTVAKFSQCQTVLLWPYVTTVTGFNTGFAIANTSQDPGATVLGTAASGTQAGACALYIYGTAEFGTQPANPIMVPLRDATGAACEGTTGLTIAAGTAYANDLASIFGKDVTKAGCPAATSAFSLSKGYMFGVCNFQYAHGYAAISDAKAANWVTSYLALIVAPSANNLRGTSAEQYIH
jgi:hypothetical protein